MRGESLSTCFVASLLLLVQVNAQDEATVSVTNAHLIPEGFIPSENSTQLFVELSEEVDLKSFRLTAEEEFECSDILDVFEEEATGEERSLLSTQNCSFCPEEGLSPTQGILTLPKISELEEAEADSSQIFIRFIDDSSDATEIQILPSAPTVVSVGIVTDNSLGVIFSAPVQAIRGQRFPSSFSTFCGNIISNNELTLKNCNVAFDVIATGMIVSVADTEVELQDLEVAFQPDVFYGAEERYGIRPVVLNPSNLGSLPGLSGAAFLSDFSFELSFNKDMLTENFDRFLCSDLFGFSIDEEDVWLERTDLFCALRWQSKTSVSLQFTDLVPFLVDGEFFIKALSPEALSPGVPKIAAANGLGLATGKVSVSIGNDAYNALDFNIIFPSDLTKCDESFIIEVQKTAGPPVLLDFEFNVGILVNSVDNVDSDSFCTGEGNVLRCTSVTDASAINVKYSVAVSYVAFISNNINSTIFIGATIEIEQNLGATKIPISVASVNGANPELTIERGTASTLKASIGDAFGCVDAPATVPLDLSWTISNDTNVVLANAGRKTITIIDELDPGSYSASFGASLSANPPPELSSLLPSEVSFTLTVLAAPVIALSPAGETVVFSNVTGTLVLDASSSCNPNEIRDCNKDLGFLGESSARRLQTLDLLGRELEDDAEIREKTGFSDPKFAFNWECIDCGNLNDTQIFGDADRNSMILSLNLSESLDIVPSTLTFEFTILEDGAVVQTFDIAANLFEESPNCFTPVINISPVDPKVNVDSSLTIFGSVVGFSTDFNKSLFTEIAWGFSTTAASASPVLTNEDTISRENLFLPPNTLVEGESYTFRLGAVPKCFVSGGSVAFKDVSFVTNKRPTGGELRVSPENGLAVTDVFTLTAVNWVDPDGDGPLEFAFEIAFVRTDELSSIDEIDPQLATQIRDFSPVVEFQTRLPLPPDGFTIVLISLARDKLGSVSRRVLSSSNTNVQVSNPFVDASGNVNVDVVLLTALIQDLSNTGEKAEIPFLCAAISTALNGVTLPADDPDLKAILLSARNLCLGAVGDTLKELDEDEVSVGLVNLAANSVKEVSGGIDEADGEFLGDLDEQTTDLISLLDAKIKAQQRGSNDPTAASLLPDSFRNNVINTIGNGLSIADVLLGDSTTVLIPSKSNGASKRRLQGEVDKCRTVEAARSNIESLANVQNSFVVAGAPPVDAQSSQVRFAAVRESFNDVGKKVDSISVPGGQNDVKLPPGFADDVLDKNEGLDANTDVNVLATKWNFAVRCEQRNQTELSCQSTYDYNAPLPGKEGPIVAVDFFPYEGDTKKSLVVEGLSQPIVIILDAPEDISKIPEVVSQGKTCKDEVKKEQDEDDVRETIATLSFPAVCGFFDEAVGDFDTTGCVTEILNDGRIQCSCTHATDYAAWQSFKYDVSRTFKSPVVFTPLATGVIFTFFPIVFGLAIVMFIWAVKADKRDSKNILKASLARIKLFRVMNQRKKSKFFDNYEYARLEVMMGEQDKDPFKFLDSTDDFQLTRKRSTVPWWMQFYLAIKYEHSVIGIHRYDPNFSRVQRVAVFFSVVICSFGAAAFVFNLDQYGVGILVTIGVSFISAFMVSIPVKLIVRLLFKATSNFIGTHHDMVNNMYRVLSRVEKADGVEAPEDRALVDSIHKYMDLSMKVESASQQLSRDASSRQTAALATTTQVAIIEEDDGEIGQAQIVEEDEGYDLTDLVVAKQLFDEAKSEVKIATVSARIYWGEASPETNADEGLVSKPLVRTFYTSWDKIKSSRIQPNGFLKLANVVSEEPSPVAKHRAPWFPSNMVFLNWIALSLVVGFYSYYIFKFITTRRELAEKPSPALLAEETVPLSEADYIQQWVFSGLGGILISYLVAEPLIALIRYVLLPSMVATYGRKLASYDVREIRNAKLDPANKDKNIREGYAHTGFDLAADIIESLF